MYVLLSAMLDYLRPSINDQLLGLTMYGMGHPKSVAPVRFQ
jgi:hypothetical protein